MAKNATAATLPWGMLGRQAAAYFTAVADCLSHKGAELPRKCRYIPQMADCPAANNFFDKSEKAVYTERVQNNFNKNYPGMLPAIKGE